MGDGEPLPESTLEFNEGVDTAELPDKVGVYLGPTLFEVHLPLVPVVSTDLFSNLQVDPDSLLKWSQTKKAFFYQFPTPDKNAFPVYDPERPPMPWNLWRPLPPVLFKLMQLWAWNYGWVSNPQWMPPTLQPSDLQNRATYTHEMQDKLRNEVLRCYQIKLPFTIPDWGEITDHSQYILEADRAFTVEDKQTGVFMRAPAYVYGSYVLRSYGINSEAYWNQLTRPIDPKNQLIYQGGFSIDPEHRIVRFDKSMYRYGCPPNWYVDAVANIFDPTKTIKVPNDAFWHQQTKIGQACLVLVTSIRLLTKDRNQTRYGKTVDITPEPKRKKTDRKGLPDLPEPLIDWSIHEDTELRAIVKYDRDTANYAEKWIKPVKTEYQNKDECEKNADYYLSRQMQKYQTKVPQRARYPGLFPIALDGAIEQVTYYSSSTGGAFTIACRDSEWAYGALLPFAQRRQVEELYNYRRLVNEAGAEQAKSWRRWVFVPTGQGGTFGVMPPAPR